MAITFQKLIAPFSGNSPLTSPAFTPGAAADTLIFVSVDFSNNVACTFSGTGGSYTTSGGSFPYADPVFDETATGYLLSASGSSQTTTCTATSGDGLVAQGIDYSGVSSVGAPTVVSRSSPGTAANAITGTAVSVPSGSTLLAFCYNATSGADTITTSGTNRGSGAGTDDFDMAYCWGEWAGSGGSITPQFTTSADGTDGFAVIQWVLTGSGASGAALAGTPTAASTAAGALTTGIDLTGAPTMGSTASGAATTGIKLAGAAVDTSSGSGTVGGLIAAAVASTLASGRLNSDFVAAATAVTTAVGALTTAIKMAAAATASFVGSAALTNWSTVTLALPLYTGAGSILDAEGEWSNGAPGAGNTVYYDGTNMTIGTDGSIVATSNSFTAILQWDNGGTWSQLTVIVTPGLSSYPTLGSALNASLSTGIQLAAAALAASSATASLSTGIELAGAASDVTTAAANLLTAIELAAAVTATSTGSGSLGGGAQFTASATAATVMVGALTTGIQLAGAATAVTTAVAALLTQIIAAGAASDTTAASAALTTGIPLGGAASDTSAAAANLTTRIELLGAALSVTTAAANLLTQIQLAAAVTLNTIGTAALTTGGGIAATPADISAATGQLSTQVHLLGAAVVASTVIGALATEIELAGSALGATQLVGTFAPPVPLAGSAEDEADVQAALGYAGSAILIADFILGLDLEEVLAEIEPIGFFFQRVGDALRYGIDWTRWLAQRWLARQQVAYGDVVRSTQRSSVQFRCVQAGVTGFREPRWPGGICAQVLDGNTIWETEPLDDTSLSASIPATASVWQPTSSLIAVSNVRVFDGRIALATINTSNALAGNDYDVACAVAATDGRQRAAKIRLKVR